MALNVAAGTPTVLVPDNERGRLEWRLNQTPGRKCRQFVHRLSCGKPAIAELNRGRHVDRLGRRVDAWWGYCEDHLYGRVILEGDFYYPREAYPDELP